MYILYNVFTKVTKIAKGIYMHLKSFFDIFEIFEITLINSYIETY